jgi:two-component sensor histidine kinase
MLFCTTIAVQLWCDAYNFQFSLLPWRWALWYHLSLEHLTFCLNYASICHFALIFPAPHPLMQRFPRGLPLVVYLANPLIIAVVMLLSPTASAALFEGNRVSLFVMLVQLGLATIAGIRSFRIARDPVSRAQMRWVLWAACLGFAIAVPGYFLPLILVGQPLIPNPVIMLLTILVPLVYAIAVLRYRLFDIEIIINRTLVYGTLTALLAGFYLLLVRVLTMITESVLRRSNDTLVVFAAAVSIALAFDPLRRRVQTVIDRAFYRSKLDYQRLLPDMSERVATSIIPDQLTELLTDELPERLQIAWAALVVPDLNRSSLVPAGDDKGIPALPMEHPLVAALHRRRQPLLRLQPPSHLPAEAQSILEQHGIELSIPLIVGDQLVGLYNLGSKLSGDAYNRDEVRFLHILGQQAAFALEHTRLHEQAQLEIAARLRAEEQIKTSLNEKELLLKEIHHRVKNNLQVISSLLYLQSRQIEDEETLGMFLESQHRVRSMALVHERLYQTQDLSKVDTADYIRTLASQLFRSYSASADRTQLTINADNIALGIDVAVPCGLIINELLSNALKHAFPGTRMGRVFVGLTRIMDGQINLVVSDDGVGFPEDLDFRQTQSLGLQLVNTLVQQLEGTIELDRSHGTKFEIVLPRAE